MIFDLYVNRNMGYSPIAQYLNGHGEIRERNENDHNRVYDDWTTDQIKKILDNPLYTGRIAYGRTRLASGGVQGKTRRVKQDDYILSEQVFEAIISDEIFEKAKIKRSVKGDDRFNKIGKTNKHLLSGICKCPDCGKSMVIDCNQWIDKHGEKKQKHYYSCGHYKKSGKYGSCRKNSVPAEITENEVIQFTKQLLRNEELAQDIKERIGSTVDVSSLDKEIEQISKQITNINKQIRNAENDIDAIIEDDKHAKRKRDGLNRRLDEFYDKIDYAEGELQNLNKTRQTAMQESFTTEAIYKMLMCFDTIYDKMDATERRSLIETMISDVHLYTIEEREQMTNVTYVKDIQYSFPVTDKVLNSMRDNLTTVESVVLMSKR